MSNTLSAFVTIYPTARVCCYTTGVSCNSRTKAAKNSSHLMKFASKTGLLKQSKITIQNNVTLSMNDYSSNPLSVDAEVCACVN